VLTLSQALDGLIFKLRKYETERLTLDGRLLLLLLDEHADNNKDKASIRQEVEPAIARVTQRSEKIAFTIQEIRQTLKEYASECSTTQCLTTGDKAEEAIVGRKKASTGAIRADGR
jgi:hypothetical protein